MGLFAQRWALSHEGNSIVVMFSGWPVWRQAQIQLYINGVLIDSSKRGGLSDALPVVSGWILRPGGATGRVEVHVDAGSRRHLRMSIDGVQVSSR